MTLHHSSRSRVAHDRNCETIINKRRARGDNCDYIMNRRRDRGASELSPIQSIEVDIRTPRRVVKKSRRRIHVTIPVDGYDDHRATTYSSSYMNVYPDNFRTNVSVVGNTSTEDSVSRTNRNKCQLGSIGNVIRGLDGTLWGKVISTKGSYYRLTSGKIAHKFNRGQTWEFLPVPATETTVKLRRFIQA